MLMSPITESELVQSLTVPAISLADIIGVRACHPAARASDACRRLLLLLLPACHDLIILLSSSAQAMKTRASAVYPVS
jgi:hypothetical protein